MLIELLNDSDFVVREAAAWPLSDMGRVEAIPELINALQRGHEEGLDNDGRQTAISDLAYLENFEFEAKPNLMSVGADEKSKKI